MELTLTELVIQLSLALTCIAVAINSRGPVRTSLSGVLATAVVGMTALLLILGLGTGTFSAIASDVRAERQAAAAEKDDVVKVSGRLAVPGEAAEPVTEEMKAPQRMLQEERAARSASRSTPATPPSPPTRRPSARSSPAPRSSGTPSASSSSKGWPRRAKSTARPATRP